MNSAVLQKYHQLLAPSDRLVTDLLHLEGDILILGVSGKMGPDLAVLAQAAIRKAGLHKKIIGVARFTESSVLQRLNEAGVTTIQADVLDAVQLQKLPHTENVLYLAGTKFGTTGHEPYTWAMNTYVPALVAQHWRQSRLVVFSTGNVYPLTPVAQGGATESTPVGPLGEYAQSCLGRERMFQYFSQQYQTPGLIYRLNYANDVSYGVLLEIARAVYHGQPVDVTMGYVNVIWQGDANEYALRCLNHCSCPPRILNITGPEILSVRQVAQQFADIFKRAALFSGQEADTALLSNASAAMELLGRPLVSLDQMVHLIAEWVQLGGPTKNKPTHFQERRGQF